MTQQQTLVDRIKLCLQDPALDSDAPSWLRSQVLRQSQQEVQRLARQRAFLTPLWCQAVAGKTHYPLNELGIFVQSGTATGGSGTTLVDTAVDFTTTVTVGDRVRVFPDNADALVTSVATTTLTCDPGFTGGVLNAPASGDTYLIETPLQQSQVCEVVLVLYDGMRLDYATPDALSNARGRWEARQTGPRYWTVDETTMPSVLHLSPPPLVTGSAAVQIPPFPMATRWEDNLLLFVAENPQQVFDEADDSYLLPCWEDLVCMRTVETLAMMEGDAQDQPLAQGMGQLCHLWAGLLGMRRYQG